MIKISKATKKEALAEEWRLFTITKYGENAKWKEESFRFKAVEDGELVGTIEGKVEGDVLYIFALMTSEKARGKGIGKMLINNAEKFGRKLRARKMWLLTGSDWASNGFYKKLGFHHVTVIPNLYFDKDFNVYIRSIK